MAISSRHIDPAILSESVTNAVRFWIEDEDADDPTPFSPHAGGCVKSGPRHAVLDAPDLAEAAEALRRWFTDHLTAERRSGNPCDRLAADLITAALGAVDWPELADDIWD